MSIVVLRRRLFYICAMVAILGPLYVVGNPSVREQDGSVQWRGGALARLRTEYNLGQGDLGDIDPASESMRLATLGLRGVAATILWQKASYYKKEHYWDRLSATLNQIAVLQPHFVKVWDFQAHNLSYNVSVEFDDYRHRYQWVKRGMNFLVKGSKYNKHRTEFPYQLGWSFGNKFGVADEKEQFRELYRADDNFHAEMFDGAKMDLAQPGGRGPDGKPDNWLSGRLWFERTYQMVVDGATRSKSAIIFYRLSPQWLMNYSEGIQRDGWLGEEARYAWRTAGREWERFGERQILTSFGDTIFLTELSKTNDELIRVSETFQELCGETYGKLRAERMAELSAEELDAYEKDSADRTFQEVISAARADSKIDIDPLIVARAMPESDRVEAMQMSKRINAIHSKIQHINIYRNQLNYHYWEQRCIAEQEDSALEARGNMYEADKLLNEGQLDAALEKYELAWAAWETLFNKFPAMMVDDVADEVLKAIARYRRLLDEPQLPKDFGLAKFIEFRDVYDQDLADPGLLGVISSWPTKYPGRNFLDEMLRKSMEFIRELDQMDGKAPWIPVLPPDEGRPPSPKI